MAYLVDHASKLIFAFTPRAGATISTMLFLRHRGLLQAALDYSKHRWVHNYRMDVYQRENPLSGENLRDPEYFRCKVVRNPFDRAVSSYIMLIKRPETARKAGVPAQDLSFAEFVDWLETRDIRKIDVHARQQKDFEVDDPAIFDVICRLENLEEDLKRVNQMTKLCLSSEGLSVPHGTRIDKSIRQSVLFEPWSRIRGRIPEYAFFYNPVYREKIRRIYKEDFQAYYPDKTDRSMESHCQVRRRSQ